MMDTDTTHAMDGCDAERHDRCAQVVRLLQSNGYCVEQHAGPDDVVPYLKFWLTINGEPLLVERLSSWPAEKQADEMALLIEDGVWKDVQILAQQKFGPGTLTRLDNKRATWRTE